MLRQLGSKNYLDLSRVPGHEGIAGCEMVNQLAREDSSKEVSSFSCYKRLDIQGKDEETDKKETYRDLNFFKIDGLSL